MKEHVEDIYLLTGDNGSGKTRYLSHFSEKQLALLKAGKSAYTKLICLSGTVYEKFPKPNKDNLRNIWDNYYYFGYKTNNNMFSEITPFRMVISIWLNDGLAPERALYADKLMQEIGFGSTVKLEFRWGRNSREERSNKLEPLEIDLKKGEESTLQLLEFKKLVIEGKAHLNKIYFCKDEKEHSVTDLSSGERLFVLVILSLCFSMVDKALVLFDEPENSMHPKWQEKITQVICKIYSKFGTGSKLLIATHSPLVVSSVPNKFSRIKDLNVDEIEWRLSHFNGNNADSILKQHFGMISARSSEFVVALQECLSSAVNQRESFPTSLRKLKSLNISLDPDDPLFDAYNSLLEHGE